MNIYYNFYCRAYDWYNTTGNKSKETLRGSSLILIAALFFINFFIVDTTFSIWIHYSYINKWGGLILMVLLIILNFLIVSVKKSDTVREEYLLMDDQLKSRINIFFYTYLIVSLLLLIIVMVYTAYYKNKYGNYD